MFIKTLLITAIGGDIAQSTVNIIRKKRPDIHLIGTDISTKHAGELFVDKFIKIPHASSSNYLQYIKKLIKEFNLDAILPMSETELSIFADIDNTINNCLIIHCGQKALKVGLDKLATNEFLKYIGIPAPWTCAVPNDPITLPCILKPKTGSGSKNTCIVNDDTDIEYFNKKYTNYIYQELLLPSNQEITCAVYRTKSGMVYVLQMLRKLIDGATSWARIVNYEEITKLCIKIANELSVIGSINIQLINTKKGAYIFEINPRISSTALMRDKIGFTDVIWLLDELEGKQILKPNIEYNKIMLRTHNVTILDTND